MPTKWSSGAVLTSLLLLLNWGCSSSGGGSGAVGATGGSAGTDDYGAGGAVGAHGGSAGSPSGPGPTSCRNDSCAATAVSVGPDFACAVMRDGSVQCWGLAAGGGLGRGDHAISGFEPAPVVNLSGAVGVAVNGQASCALLQQGSVSCWGDGAISGYGTGTTMESETPADVMVGHATALTRGLTSICASIDGGSAECWQDVLLFAPDAPIPALRPAPVPAVQGAKEIAQGSDHLCMLSGDGTVQCMGSNEHSQLGTGRPTTTWSNQRSWSRWSGCLAWQHISAGDDFTCALLQNGSVSCWGDIPGQAGDPNFDGYPTPVAVPGLSSVTALSATSANHVCALLKDGSVACWGENSDSESGGDSADTGRHARDGQGSDPRRRHFDQ